MQQHDRNTFSGGRHV